MITTRRSYRRLEAEYAGVLIAFEDLKGQWNDLVTRVNDLGGEPFLSKATQQRRDFSEAEIRTLIKLCHPDKHRGDPAAGAITAKLLALRE